jgi:hypothetical protein
MTKAGGTVGTVTAGGHDRCAQGSQCGHVTGAGTEALIIVMRGLVRAEMARRERELMEREDAEEREWRERHPQAGMLALRERAADVGCAA